MTIDSTNSPRQIDVLGIGDEAKGWWNGYFALQPVIIFRSGNVLVWLGAIPRYSNVSVGDWTPIRDASYGQLLDLARIIERRIMLQ